MVRANSHNDEMQAFPFETALSLGLGSIEVDIRLKGDQLLIGHEEHNLNERKTLQSVYLEPLKQMLDQVNNTTRFEASDPGMLSRSLENNNTLAAYKSLAVEPRDTERSWIGILPGAPQEQLALLIDMKAEPAVPCFHKLRDAIQPLVDTGYLTVYRNGTLFPGPVTIIGTGSTPLDLVYKSNPRFIFYDAPLVDLQRPPHVDGQQIEWRPELAPIASSKWLWWQYYPNVASLSQYSREAHRLGIKVRWWGTVTWPACFRRALWSLQLSAGVDWINADHLEDIVEFLRKRTI